MCAGPDDDTNEREFEMKTEMRHDKQSKLTALRYAGFLFLLLSCCFVLAWPEEIRARVSPPSVGSLAVSYSASHQPAQTSPTPPDQEDPWTKVESVLLEELAMGGQTEIYRRC